MHKILLWLLVSVCAVSAYGQQTTEGSLYAVGKTGKELGNCTLKSTSVNVGIAGFVSRVSVRQEFQNTFSEPIEAVYVFPLSQNGAVDHMTMTVGDRVIRGTIMNRDDARKTYETAKSAGKTAALLDQERTNVFTQSVANIMPGETILIEISYVETLKYEDGAYEFVFPMTVAPRYIPAGVEDASRISPPVADTRSGSDISIQVELNAGVPVEEIRSSTHEIDQINFAPNSSRITLRGEKTIPNKDFILRYDVTGNRIEDAVLTHRDERGGFFTLILQPPDKIASEDRTPKEIVFVLDTSGSMGGFPIEKAKEAMKLSLNGLYPEDTFNLITFAGDTEILFDGPVPATRANLDIAEEFLSERQGSGGTEMMEAIKASLKPSDAADHLRIVCFMTDGEIGNEDEIIAEIQRHPNARVFSFGIGSSVNRALLDKMAQQGKGEVEYVGLNDDGSKAARRFYERVRSPLLTDISIDWNGIKVSDVYPRRMTDLFSAKPVVLHGRYSNAASGTIKLKGKMAGQYYEREINVNLPNTDFGNDALASLWARTRIDELSSERLKITDVKKGIEIDEQIKGLGLQFGLLTKFTSFVAVEDRVVNSNGDPIKILVPNQLPEGMRRETKGFEAEYGGATGGITVVTKPGTVSNGQGGGNGNGTGYGGGGGGGSTAPNPKVVPGAIQEVVDVMSDSSNAIDMSDTKIETSITKQVIEDVPAGVTFASLLKIAPKVRPELGGFQIDGASGSENTFIVDGMELMKVGSELDGLDLANLRSRMLPGNTNETRRTNYRLQGRMVDAADPIYPAAAIAAKALGKVVVDISIDRNGDVISASATSGNELLRKAAESAAMLSRFSPTSANGVRVRVQGQLLYDFQSPENIEVFVRKMKALPLNEEEKRLYGIAAKLHVWLFDLVERLESGNDTPGTTESMYISNGRANVSITVTSMSDDVRCQLNDAGFKSGKETARSDMMIGSVPIEKISTLARIKEVKLILPR